MLEISMCVFKSTLYSNCRREARSSVFTKMSLPSTIIYNSVVHVKLVLFPFKG